MISDVITGVRAELAERGVPAEVLDGEEHLPRNNADGEVGQRVVFIETADTYPPLGMTGSGKNPPAKLLRAAGAVVHIWGVSAAADATPDDHRATTRTLLHQVLLAIRKAGGGSSNMGMEFTGGEWTRGGENRYGAEYVLQIVVKVPVVEEPWPVAEGVPFVGQSNMSIGGETFVGCGGLSDD